MGNSAESLSFSGKLGHPSGIHLTGSTSVFHSDGSWPTAVLEVGRCDRRRLLGPSVIPEKGGLMQRWARSVCLVGDVLLDPVERITDFDEQLGCLGVSSNGGGLRS